MDENEDCLASCWEDFLSNATNEVLMATSAAGGMAMQDAGDSGGWNPDTFAALPDSWKLHKEDEHRRRNVNRLQDLSFSLDTDITDTRQQETWPFENSSCRLFRGSTQKTSQSAVDTHQRLFNPDFSSKQQESFEEFDEYRPDDETALYFEIERTASVAWEGASSPTIPLHAGCIRQHHGDSFRAFKRRRSCGDIQNRPQHVHPHNIYLNERPTVQQVERDHTSDRVGIARGGTPLSKSKSDHPKVYCRNKGDHCRRPMVKRAMPTDNTVPPEHYQKETLLRSENAGGIFDTSAAANSTNINKTISGHKICYRKRPPRQVSEKGIEESEFFVAAEKESTCVPGYLYRHCGPNEKTEQDSISSGSFSDDHGFGCDDSNAKPGTSDNVQAKFESGGNTSIARRRFLRQLWGQVQPVTTDDFRSADHRGFLHSVVYRHRMGIQFSALRSQIELELMQDPLRALQKPERSLYVELLIPK